jgi:hypothetical protein
VTRLRSNFLFGQISNNPLASGATAVNSPSFAELPVIASPNYMAIVLDPQAVFGAPEIIHVTAHASGATVVTADRAQENTAARSHQVNEVWINAPTELDFDATAIPSTSNVGDSAAIGNADADAKADHLHAREGWATSAPAALIIGSGDIGDLTNPARHNHSHPVALIMPDASLPTDTGYAGAPGDSLASALHQHAREGFGTPLSSTPTDTPVQGSGPAVAPYNHVHGREGVGVPGSSAPGDAASQGAGPTIAYSNHVHARESLGAPTDSNYGDTTVTGSSTSVASGGHRHRRIAPVTVAGNTDTSGPTWGGTSNQLATIGGVSGQPKVGPITPPPSGMARFDFGFSGWQAGSGNQTVDFYLGVGWSTSNSRSGAWAGAFVGAIGSSGSPWDWIVVWVGLADGAVATFDNVKAFSGSFYATSLPTANPLYFYLLWGSTGGSMTCPSNTRTAARYGTYLRVTTVP